MFSLQPGMLACVLSRSHDVYILPNIMSYLDVWACIALSRIVGCRVCLWGHGKGSLNGSFAKIFRKFFMNLADALVFYSDSAWDSWCGAGIPPKKMFVAYNALDTEESAQVRSEISDRDMAEFIRSNGLAGKKIILFSGRLQKRKRLDLIVDAMARIVTRVPDAHAVIIGEGVMRSAVEKRISELSLEKHISLAGAIFDEKTIAHYLLAAHVAVMPAAAGLFIQQAFDYGLPLLVGDDMHSHGPEIELVREGENGIFFRDGDCDHLAEQLFKLLANEDKRRQMSLNAKRVIESKYNVNAMAEGLLRAICFSIEKDRL
jgi:glycosyltransferase involved in cell wall biosynthesis